MTLCPFCLVRFGLNIYALTRRICRKCNTIKRVFCSSAKHFSVVAQRATATESDSQQPPLGVLTTVLWNRQRAGRTLTESSTTRRRHRGRASRWHRVCRRFPGVVGQCRSQLEFATSDPGHRLSPPRPAAGSRGTLIPEPRGVEWPGTTQNFRFERRLQLARVKKTYDTQ